MINYEVSLSVVQARSSSFRLSFFRQVYTEEREWLLYVSETVCFWNPSLCPQGHKDKKPRRVKKRAHTRAFNSFGACGAWRGAGICSFFKPGSSSTTISSVRQEAFFMMISMCCSSDLHPPDMAFAVPPAVPSRAQGESYH